jgi:hypothetical protein
MGNEKCWFVGLGSREKEANCTPALTKTYAELNILLKFLNEQQEIC